jgi:hypothetical protein
MVPNADSIAAHPASRFRSGSTAGALRSASLLLSLLALLIGAGGA